MFTAAYASSGSQSVQVEAYQFKYIVIERSNQKEIIDGKNNIDFCKSLYICFDFSARWVSWELTADFCGPSETERARPNQKVNKLS